jgi:hypothetical protein
VRQPVEDDPELLTERRSASSGGGSVGTERRLIPLARAQDAVARLEALVGACTADIAAGLRARFALFEAAAFLAHHSPAVHPHYLALRDAGLTGSFAVAAMSGRLKQEAP